MPTKPDEATQLASQREVGSHQGSLRSKLVLSLAAIFVVFLWIDELVRRRVIEPEFAVLERAGAVRDAHRVMAAIDSEVEHLGELAEKWAVLLRHRRPDVGVPPATMGVTALGAKDCDWMVLASCDDTATGCAWNWIQSGTSLSVAERNAAEESLSELVAFCRRSGQSLCSGITALGHRSPAIFSVVELDHPEVGGQRGAGQYLLAVRHVGQERLADLCRQTQVDFTLQALGRDAQVQEQATLRVEDATLIVDVPLSGVHGERPLAASVRVPREMVARSIHTTKLARNSFIFGSVAALLILLVMLQQIVIGPLAAIREHSNRVAKEGFSAEPLLLTRNDEIGQLARAFDEMVGDLSDAQTQLARASQAAGRSQVAGTVIHNVGNVLTNVNSLLDAASTGVEGLRIGPLDKLAARLRRDRNNEILLAATPDYLEGLAASLKSDQTSIQELLSTLHDNVRHIHDVIRDQQRHADPSIRLTRVSLQAVVEEAIACCRAKLDDEMISVEIAGSLRTSVCSDHSLLLQTMINIIGNARHAMRDNCDRARILSIGTEHTEETVRLLFRDNGCGMTQETIQRVFDAHFTTRESGTGLGLHFCALTLNRLGGSIRTHSDGPGLGAMFILEFPSDPPHGTILSDVRSIPSTTRTAVSQ